MNSIPKLEVRVIDAFPKHFKATDPKHLAVYWRAREKIRNQWFKAFTKTCRTQFGKEQGAVKAAYRSGGEKAVAKTISAGAGKWVKLYKAMYIGMAEDLAPMLFNQYEGEKSRPIHIRADQDEWLTFLLNYLDKTVTDKIKGMTKHTTDQVVNVITRGLAAEESMEDIVSRIDNLYNDSIKPVRSMTIARTEITSASNAATQTTGEYMAEKYELDIVKRWLTARDASVRDSHTAMEGVEVELDESFNVNGSTMLHPGDTSMGADLGEIVNCRCDVAQRVR